MYYGLRRFAVSDFNATIVARKSLRTRSALQSARNSFRVGKSRRKCPSVFGTAFPESRPPAQIWNSKFRRRCHESTFG